MLSDCGDCSQALRGGYLGDFSVGTREDETMITVNTGTGLVNCNASFFAIE